MRRGGGRLDRVGDGDEPGRPAVDGDEHHRLALALQRLGRRSSGGARAPSSRHHRGVAERDARPSTVPLTPLPVIASKSAGRRASAPRASAPRDDRLGQRMLGAALERGGEPQQLVLVAVRRDDVGRAPACPRSACRSCRRPACRPWRSAPAPRRCVISTPACAPAPGRDHDRHRRRQAERAGTGDDQHRDRRDQRIGEGRRRAEAAPRRRRRATATATTAGTNQPATRSASAWIGARERWALGDHLDDPRQHRVRADPLGAHDEAAGAVERAAGHARRPRSSPPAPARRSASTRRPTERPSTTAPSTGTLSPGRTRSRSPTCTSSSGDLLSVPSAPIAPRGLRREVEQRADRRAGALAGPQLQDLAERSTSMTMTAAASK